MPAIDNRVSSSRRTIRGAQVQAGATFQPAEDRLNPTCSEREYDCLFTRTRTLAILGLLITPALAAAQNPAATPYEQRGYVQFGAGAQSGSELLTSTSTFTIYDEQGTINSSQTYGGGAIWGLGGGARVWRNLVVSLNYVRYSDEMQTAILANVPSPLVIGRPRVANAGFDGLEHTENQYHFTASWMIPFGENLTLGVGAGPSFIGLSHEFPSDARVQEVDGPPNYAQVAITDLSSIRSTKTVTTANFGADLTYNLPFDLGQVGKLGATVGFRYSGGTAGIDGPTGGEVDVKYGGAQFYGGVRVSF